MSDHLPPCNETQDHQEFDRVAGESAPDRTMATVQAIENGDYPLPRSLVDDEEFVWNEEDLAINNYRALGRRLAGDDLYRRTRYASGLFLASQCQGIEPEVIDNARRFAAIIADRVRVRVVKGGNTRGSSIPVADLNNMLASEVFLQQFCPVDAVVRVPHYLPTFRLTRRGYNDGGPGQRLFYAGPDPRVERRPDAINRFLDVMAFASTADRTNAVALALTVSLRNFWPGAKPLGIITSSKSHGGKDTIVAFATGSTPRVSVDYESTDWAFRQGFIAALKACPEAGLLNIENARLGRGDRFISSAFLERFLTDPEPILHSSKVREAVKVKNYLGTTITTNDGTVSEDLMNRGFSIHLNPVGNVADRVCAIGNPKLEYLPANREQIEAELRGMIERWKEADMPLDDNARHPFTDWARTIGGILTVSGYTDFLGNYSLRRTADDPLRRALGLLGAAQPREWLRADNWAHLAVTIGVVKTVIAEHDRTSDRGRERGIGVVLSAHRDETFEVETDAEKMTLKLEKARRRFDGGEPTTRYRFVILQRTPLPEDPNGASTVECQGQKASSIND